MLAANTNNTIPKIGEGIFLVKDVAKILRLDYSHVRRWILGYWDGHFKRDFNYTFGEDGNKAINFYSLIEFYIFYKLREQNVSAVEIKKIHERISEELQTPYPFALPLDFYVENRKTKTLTWYGYLENLIKTDGKHQISLNFVKPFLKHVDFDNNLASRYFPLENTKSVVVDPKHQFGQPTISGTNIQTNTVFGLYQAGETKSTICKLYDINLPQVDAAIYYHKLRA